MSFLNTTEKAFGLDISANSLRLIELKKKGQKIFVQNYNEVNLPANCLKDGEIVSADGFLAALEKLLATKRGAGKLSDEVISVLPEEKTFMKVLELPSAETANMPAKIQEYLPENLPLEMAEIYFDWQVIEKTSDQQTILIGASPQKIIDSYVAVLSRAKLIPTVMEIEAAAISRVLVEQTQDTAPQIIIDIGANRTGFFLYDRQTVKFTVSLPISGQSITQLIVNTVGLEAAKAEQAKIVCGLDPQKCHGALLEIFSATIDNLTQEIKKAAEFYYGNFKHTENIAKIVLTGGGANFAGIAPILSQKLALPVFISEPFKNIINPDPRYFTPQKIQSFTTALGLALRGLKPETFL